MTSNVGKVSDFLQVRVLHNIQSGVSPTQKRMCYSTSRVIHVHVISIPYLSPIFSQDYLSKTITRSLIS